MVSQHESGSFSASSNVLYNTLTVVIFLLTIVEILAVIQVEGASKEFIAFYSDLHDDKTDNDLLDNSVDLRHKLQTGSNEGEEKFARTKRRHGGGRQTSATGKGWPVESSSQSKKTSEQTKPIQGPGANTIPAASPNFEAAFQGKSVVSQCRQSR